MLYLGMKPPFSYAQFFKMCQRFISAQDVEALRNLPQKEGEYKSAIKNKTVEMWLGFDTALRNELVKLRARDRHIEPAKYLRGVKQQVDSEAVRVAISAHRSPSLIDAEKMLDEARWKALDEFVQGHYFDTEIIIAYAYKLTLLERWERINSADKIGVLESVLRESSKGN